MKLLVLVFLVSSISIPLILGTPLQYDEKYSFELISIDQYLLTKRDPTLTPKDLRHQQRSLLSAPTVTTKQEVIYGSSVYLMSLGVGTPPQNVYLSLDTGSDITWLQCSNCKNCYYQWDPIFSPNNSKTFSQVHCGGPRCKQLQGHSDGCGGKHNKTCLYKATYGSGSFSQGVFSTETLTLQGRRTTLPNISFGCGRDNQGEWTADSDGLLGLGRGELSFITQTKDLFKSQFSYCLAYSYSNTSNSSIVFGPYVVPDGKHVYYTPLIYTNIDTYYHVNLTAILVNGIPVSGINSSISDVKPHGAGGGVIIDSGTAYTRLVNENYVALRNAFREAVWKSNSQLGSPGNFKWFDTCYNITQKMGNVSMPTVELHFDGGATMTLGWDNTMILMDSTKKVRTVCFAFESDDWVTTIGNFQQQSFQIVYDVPDNRIGIVPEAC